MKAHMFGLTALALAACSAHESDANRPQAANTPDCTRITSAVERLACFDAVAGTPARLPAAPSPPADQESGNDAPAQSPIVALVERNEGQRRTNDRGFLLSRSVEDGSRATQIVISAPASGVAAPFPLLALSCVSGISRVQLISQQSINSNRVRIQLLMDGKAVADAGVWQTLDGGHVVDAGRGLVAIDLLKRMGAGQRLQLASDYRPLDGLLFDATGLDTLVAQQREACHW